MVTGAAGEPHGAGGQAGGAAEGPLAGLRVLDLSRVLAGPYAAMLLADAGADVIKVEPVTGDDTRAWGPPYVPGAEPRPGYPGDSAYYTSCNRGKRGMAVDVSKPEGQAIIRALAAQADVVIENFKLGTMERWGLGYEQCLHPLNPRLVYCNISGFGRDGPYARLPGYDFAIQAMAGIMSITGEPDGEPQKVGVAIADLTTGMMAAFGIMAALWGRAQTGQGQRVDLSLYETTVGWLANVAANHLVGGREPKRYGNAHANVVPYQVFPARDRPFVVAVGNDRQFQRLCDLLGAPELAADPRFATNPARLTHRDELIPRLADLFRRREAAHWIEQLQAAGIPVGPIQTVPEVLRDPHTLHRRMRVDVPHPTAGTLPVVGVPFKFGSTPTAVRRHPPLLGEHTAEILAELGYSQAQIAELEAAGVVRCCPLQR